MQTLFKTRVRLPPPPPNWSIRGVYIFRKVYSPGVNWDRLEVNSICGVARKTRRCREESVRKL